MPRKRNATVRNRSLTVEQQAHSALTVGVLGETIPESDWERLRVEVWRLELEASLRRPSPFLVPFIATIMDGTDALERLAEADAEVGTKVAALLDHQERVGRARAYLRPLQWDGERFTLA